MGWEDSIEGIGLGVALRKSKKISQQKIIGDWGSWGKLAHRAQVMNSKRFLFHSFLAFPFYVSTMLHRFCLHFSSTTDKQVNPVAPPK